MKEKIRIREAIKELNEERKLYDPEYAWDGTNVGDWVGILELAVSALIKREPAEPQYVSQNGYWRCRDCGAIIDHKSNYCQNCGKAIAK